MSLRFETTSDTHVGGREPPSEDKCLAWDSDRVCFAVVCDGHGGLTFVEAVLAHLINTRDAFEQTFASLADPIDRAHYLQGFVHDLDRVSPDRKSGTTLVAFVCDKTNGNAFFVQVGDSRAGCRLRDNSPVFRLGIDGQFQRFPLKQPGHLLDVEEHLPKLEESRILAYGGTVDWDEDLMGYRLNDEMAMGRAIGDFDVVGKLEGMPKLATSMPDVYLFRVVDVTSPIVMCSDGLTGVVPLDKAIDDPQCSAKTLIAAALAGKTDDNVTAIVLRLM